MPSFLRSRRCLLFIARKESSGDAQGPRESRSVRFITMCTARCSPLAVHCAHCRLPLLLSYLLFFFISCALSRVHSKMIFACLFPSFRRARAATRVRSAYEWKCQAPGEKADEKPFDDIFDIFIGCILPKQSVEIVIEMCFACTMSVIRAGAWEREKTSEFDSLQCQFYDNLVFCAVCCSTFTDSGAKQPLTV